MGPRARRRRSCAWLIRSLRALRRAWGSGFWVETETAAASEKEGGGREDCWRRLVRCVMAVGMLAEREERVTGADDMVVGAEVVRG